MSFWGRAGLLAAGAAAGYLASRRAEQIRAAGKELAVLGRTSPVRSGDATAGGTGEAIMRLWSSAPAAPLRAGALKAVRFAAIVRQGMQEREAELNQRFANQQTSHRPGDLHARGEDFERLPVTEDLADAGLPLESGAADPVRRVRDDDLPEDFFRPSR